MNYRIAINGFGRLDAEVGFEPRSTSRRSRRSGTEIEMPGTVVAGILAVGSAEDVLRHGFEAARDRDVPLHVLVGEPAAGTVDELHELIERWTEKYPTVPVTVSVRAGLDAAIVLAAGAHGAELLVVAEACGTRERAIIGALSRRVRCPVDVV